MKEDTKKCIIGFYRLPFVTKNFLHMFRRLYFLVFLLLLGILVPAWAQDSVQVLLESGKIIPKVTNNYYLGDAQIRVVYAQKTGTKLIYFNMHDNENTSAQAGWQTLRESGGKLVELQHTGERNLSFNLQGKKYVVDPNRIFTPLGIKKTLETNSRYHAEAAAEVEAFSNALVNDFGLNRGDLVVALHNNTPDNYTVKDYLPRGTYARDAVSVHYESGSDADDFFFVTNPLHFQRLKAEGFNVALQNNATVTDDGSFSVFCGNFGVPYINVEAEHGHLEMQKKMIRSVIRLFANL